MVKLELSGRVVRDAEAKTTSGGHEVVSFSVAVNIPYKEVESAFFDMKCWEPWSRVAKRLKKGQPVYLVATPRQESWERDGKKHSKIVWYPVSISLPPISDEPAKAASTAAAEPAKEEDPDSDNVPF